MPRSPAAGRESPQSGALTTELQTGWGPGASFELWLAAGSPACKIRAAYAAAKRIQGARASRGGQFARAAKGAKFLHRFATSRPPATYQPVGAKSASVGAPGDFFAQWLLKNCQQATTKEDSPEIASMPRGEHKKMSTSDRRAKNTRPCIMRPLLHIFCGGDCARGDRGCQ